MLARIRRARQSADGRRRLRKPPNTLLACDGAEAGLAGARSTAMVLAALPLVGIAFGELMGATPLRILTGGGIGQILLLAGIIFDCSGLAWSERIASGAAR